MNAASQAAEEILLGALEQPDGPQRRAYLDRE
jgi:hypothetical protein